MAQCLVSGVSHTVVGTLSDGTKMVVSDWVTDAGTTQSIANYIEPLKFIEDIHLSVKAPGDTPALFKMLTSNNYITITTIGAPTGCKLTTVAFGY
ncbi:MAG TPA: hypothetical protein PLW50_00370 [Smithellaceae bacterium]|nr:hypothetical protein [Smithellaceae bacterium]